MASSESPVFFILKPKTCARIMRSVIGISYSLSEILPSVKYDLEENGLEPGEYMSAAIVNTLIFSALIFSAVSFFGYYKGLFESALDFVKITGVPTLVVFFSLLGFFLYYPKMLLLKSAEMLDKDLVFALKDLLLQIDSGVSLFDGLVNISRADYGSVSDEFRTVVQDINTGMPEDKALEKLAIKTESEFLKKSLWQIVTALRSGSGAQKALESVLLVLEKNQRDQIKAYTQELNLWSMMYMVFAVAVPGLGTTILIIMSTFAGVEINETIFLVMIGSCVFVELVIIGFIKVRRPTVHML
ncbi:MAG: type II secretion system F family protein [archaeon]